MLHKYKIVLFNIFCSAIMIMGSLLLLPYIFTTEKQEKQKTIISLSPVMQENSTRTIWKRGKNSCTTTITEKRSITETSQKKSHTASGWTSIIWRKNDP